MTRPVILDVDTGIDDAMALMLAATHPDLDIRAISCVSGNVSVDLVVQNTLRILDLVDAPEIPVGAGATRPLINIRHDASFVHGGTGLGDLVLPDSTRTPVEDHAVELLRRTLADSAEKITLIALAPLTNIALLLRMHPEVADKIERVVAMGGSASIGNATAVAEFNIWHDPEAAEIVFSSGIPITMYGLDCFHRVAPGPQKVAELKTSDAPRAAALGTLLGFTYGDEEISYGLIGDAGAVACFVAPELFTITPHPVKVELAPGFSRGQTIVDRRTQVGEDLVHGLGATWPTVDVALDVEVEKVLTLFFDTVLG